MSVFQTEFPVSRSGACSIRKSNKMSKKELHVGRDEYYLQSDGKVFGPTYVDTGSELDGDGGGYCWYIVKASNSNHVFDSNGKHGSSCSNDGKTYNGYGICNRPGLKLIKQISTNDAKFLLKKEKLQEEFKEAKEEYKDVLNDLNREQAKLKKINDKIEKINKKLEEIKHQELVREMAGVE